MMTIFGEELRESLNSGRGRGKEGGGGEDGDGLDVVIAVTKHARFVDKADAISSFYRGVEESGDASNDAGSSTASGSKQPEQIWLTGYDTLLRILAPRYYAPGNLSALDPFFESCRVRVMGRAGYGEEDDITEKLRKGELESVGGRKEWCDRIDLLEGLEEEVSSTAVRKAIKDGEWGIVERLVGGKMRQWVEDKGLYR